MTSHPTLQQLRARVHKDRHREIGNWLARRFARPLAVYGTWLAVRLGLSAHHVTTMALCASLAGAVAIGTGDRAGFVFGVVLLHLAFWLDHVDGQVARWDGTAGLGGVYFDYLMHHAASLALGFALGFGLAVHDQDLAWTIAGFACAAGWTLLGLHNDCRYKSFFQHLKRGAATYRVDCGSGDRPAPPSPWPRRGRGALTWPAYKACEPHVVLAGLSLLALLALIPGAPWAASLRIYVLVMATLAPILAAARIARAIVLDSPTTEFHRWFQPWHDA
jgi:hypothetical protein